MQKYIKFQSHNGFNGLFPENIIPDTSLMSIDILLPVDISCQAEYISAKAGAVGNQTVKPAKVRINQLDNISHEKHGEQRTRANDVPFPAAKESKTAYHSEHHELSLIHI